MQGSYLWAAFFLVSALTSAPLMTNGVAGLLRKTAYVPDFSPNAPHAWKLTQGQGVRMWSGICIVVSLALAALSAVGLNAVYVLDFGPAGIISRFPPPGAPEAVYYEAHADGIEVAFGVETPRNEVVEHYRKMLTEQGWKLTGADMVSLRAARGGENVYFTFIGMQKGDESRYPCKVVTMLTNLD